MRPSQITGIAIAAFFTVTSSAFAQTQPTQTPTQDPTKEKSSDISVTQTFTGCLMTERDYRSAHNLGAGQVGGVGLGDEFVLVDVKVSPANGASAANGATATTPRSDTSATASASTTASSKCADQGTAYRVTGSDEEKLKGLVGRQLEIQGRFKHADDAAAGGTRPDEKLPAEVEMVSFREAPAATAMTESAAPQTSTSSPARPQPTPPTPATIEPARDGAAATAPRRELPRTASSTALLGLVGVLALGSGVALFVVRRRIL